METDAFPSKFNTTSGYDFLPQHPVSLSLEMAKLANEIKNWVILYDSGNSNRGSVTI